MMNNYIFIRVVGKGSYGEVNLVKHRTDRKQVRNETYVWNPIQPTLVKTNNVIALIIVVALDEDPAKLLLA